MSVAGGQMRLKRAAKDLLVSWGETSRTWRDDVSRDFNKNHLDPMMAKLRVADAAMDHMVEILERVRRDCE